MRTPVVWFELVGQHSDTLRDFYEEVLGWQRAAVPPAPPRRSRPGFPRRRPPAPAAPPWWLTLYTRVPDLDAALRAARRRGSRVLVPPTQHGDTRIAVVSDPAGHPVGLCGS
jgi:predicted enzyme related to lactoylglutathione lyase